MKKFATVTVRGKLLELDAPGLKTRRRKDGSFSIYWEAPAWAPLFRPRTVYFHPDWSVEGDFEKIAAECRALQKKARVQSQGPGIAEQPAPDGSLGALVELYLTSPNSPFQPLKASTQETYRRWIKLLRPYEHVLLSDVDSEVLRLWFEELSAPPKNGTDPMSRRATSAFQMLRMLFQFGSSAGVAYSGALERAARDRAFDETPKSRRAMTAEQAARFVHHALAVGEVRIALAQACQFELELTQAEVIGDWYDYDPARDVDPEPQIIFQRRYWSGGLMFEMLDGDVLRVPLKGELVSFDLRRHPLVGACLAQIDKREGPFVVRADGRPYDRFTFSRVWRALADAAGLPPTVWNSDSVRRGGAAKVGPSKVARRTSR